MRFAFWIPNSTNTHSEYVILSIAFPLYERLHERASMLRCTYTVCLILSIWHVKDNEMFRLKIYVIEVLFFNVSKLYANALFRAYLITGDNSRNFNWV
jgi:hypothetical protein